MPDQLMTHFNRAALLLVLTMAGCASTPRRVAQPAPIASARIASPTTRASTSIADLTLDQIAPAPVLKSAEPTTRPSDSPPVESVRLFAEARIALLDDNRAQAAELLRRAIAGDPDSFELHKSLGDLYAQTEDPRGIDEWKRAAAIEPDHLDLQVGIGRQYLARENLNGAVKHLRLALQTSDYGHDSSASAQADFLLARALQRQGYDRAALQLYERLMSRLQNPTMSLRRDPHVAILLSHPDALALNIAELYEKHGLYAAAVALLEPVATAQPRNFDIHAQLVRDNLAMGKRPQALHDAAELVQAFHASSDSLTILRQAAGGNTAAADVLKQLHEQTPTDRPVLYALIDTLVAGSRLDQADRLAAAAMRDWPDDVRLLRRRVEVFRARKDLTGAARVLIEVLARQPELDLEIAPLWESLTRPSTVGRVREADLARISISPTAEAAKWLVVARTARAHDHFAQSRDAIDKAVAVRPIFPPAWRWMIQAIAEDNSRSAGEKELATRELCDACEKDGQAALADELRGRALMYELKADAATAAFAKATRKGDRAPELYLSFATALDSIGEHQAAESLLLKLVKEHPLCEDAYLGLYTICKERHRADQASRVLEIWLDRDPDSVAARRLEARSEMEQRHYSDSQRILLELLDQYDTDSGVLAAVHQFYSETSRLDEFVSILDRHFAKEPWNFSLGELLAETLQQQHHDNQALAVADKLRQSAAGDSDLLYELSALYTRLGHPNRSEDVLQAILRVDPGYPGANNDLGYFWAEQGKKLSQARELIRKALQAEPNNPSFLDSMGWVLYKQGQFGEALEQLQRAATPADQADPQVLDHLGDTLYRLGNHQQAAQEWQQAAQRLSGQGDDARDELKSLRAGLLQKQQELSSGRPVSVAPVAGTNEFSQ
ncbi:MAG TPA: tetratricopeptide repeat protein [Tepidisphaeraceae bacterium]|nr:tetratricopeptide repeat protein [Tepidisphaeraceae bacterium]